MDMTRDNATSGNGPEDEDLAALLQRVITKTVGLSQSSLAERSGIPLATINAWINRRRGTTGRIDPDVLRQLQPHLPGVTVKQLFEAAGRRAPASLDAEREKKLLRLWRALDAEQQRVVLDTVEVMARQPRGRAAE